MGKEPKKHHPPGFAHLIAGKQSSQPKGPKKDAEKGDAEKGVMGEWR